MVTIRSKTSATALALHTSRWQKGQQVKGPRNHYVTLNDDMKGLLLLGSPVYMISIIISSPNLLFLQGYTERKNNNPDYHEYHSRERRESHAGGHAPD